MSVTHQVSKEWILIHDDQGLVTHEKTRKGGNWFILEKSKMMQELHEKNKTNSSIGHPYMVYIMSGCTSIRERSIPRIFYRQQLYVYKSLCLRKYIYIPQICLQIQTSIIKEKVTIQTSTSTRSSTINIHQKCFRLRIGVYQTYYDVWFVISFLAPSQASKRLQSILRGWIYARLSAARHDGEQVKR